MREREEDKHIEVGWITVLLSANVACLVVRARAQEAELQAAWAGVGRRWGRGGNRGSSTIPAVNSLHRYKALPSRTRNTNGAPGSFTSAPRRSVTL